MRARRNWIGMGLLCALSLSALVLGAAGASARHALTKVKAHAAKTCDSQYPSKRDPSNPLMLPQAPGKNPLNGARLFVDGPAHGPAAGEIATLLGMNPSSFADDVSWERFEAQVHLQFAVQLALDPKLAFKVRMLEKIGSEPEAQRLSAYSRGGGPGAVFAQAEKIYCHNLSADPGSVPIIVTYFLHPNVRGCTAASVGAASGAFKRQVGEVAQATGKRPAVFLLEIDALGSSSCFARHQALNQYLGLLGYEVRQLSALPHVVAYVEGGYSDSNSPSYTAEALNKVGIRQIRGFFTNDTHLNWTSKEVSWAEKVSKLAHGANFIVNTAQNGHGPKLNPHPSRQGIEDLCNPPGRGLGPRPTTQTGVAAADAWLWTHEPGNSGGSCHGGPPSGTFWPARAIGLASQANGKLGPGYPSRPY